MLVEENYADRSKSNVLYFLKIVNTRKNIEVHGNPISGWTNHDKLSTMDIRKFGFYNRSASAHFANSLNQK